MRNALFMVPVLLLAGCAAKNSTSNVNPPLTGRQKVEAAIAIIGNTGCAVASTDVSAGVAPWFAPNGVCEQGVTSLMSVFSSNGTIAAMQVIVQNMSNTANAIPSKTAKEQQYINQAIVYANTAVQLYGVLSNQVAQ
jgi:hypothetical protein